MKLQVRTITGAQCRADVDCFYERHGGHTRATNADLFFVAEEIQSDSKQDGRARAVIKGVMRYCVEEGTPMLRSMLVDETCRHQGVGAALLQAFDRFVKENKIHGVYCLPSTELEQFYGRIGFRRIDKPAMPDFLELRMRGYFAAGNPCICLKRA